MSPAPSTRNLARFIVRRALGVVAVVMLVAMVSAFAAGGFLTWALNTESGLRFVANQGSSWLRNNLGQTLEITQAKGDLWEGASLGGVVWTDDKTRIEAENLAFKVDFLTLLDQRVWVRSLAADAIRIELPQNQEPDNEPLVLPESILLPVTIDIDALNIGLLEVAKQEIRNLALRAELNQRGLNIENLALSYDGSKLALAGQMGAVKPFTLQADLTLQRNEEALKLSGDVGLKGTLERLEVAINARAKQDDDTKLIQSVVASAIVRPLGKAPLESINMQTEGFNPADWASGLPTAQLNVDLSLAPNANFTQASGKLKLANQLAGAVADNKLPVSEGLLSYTLELADALPRRVKLDIQSVTFANEAQPAGKLSGSLDWTLPSSFEDLVNQPGLLSWALNLETMQPDRLVELPFAPQLNGTFEGQLSEESIRITALDMEDRGARLKGQMDVAMGGRGQTTGELRISNVDLLNYQPSVDANAIKGQIQAELSVDGQLGSRWKEGNFDPTGLVNAILTDSTLAGFPVDLSLKVQGGTQRLEDVRIQGKVNGATLGAEGAFGKPDDELRWRLAIADMGSFSQLLGVRATGVVNANGVVKGGNDNPQITMQARATDVAVDEAASLKLLDAKLEAGLAPDSPLVGSVVLEGLRSPSSPETLITKATLGLSGATKQHQMDAVFETGLTPFSRRRVIDGRFTVNGGWSGNERMWKGQLTQTQVGGLWRPVNAFKQVGKTSLEFGTSGVALKSLVMEGEDKSVITSRDVIFTAGKTLIEGQAKGLTLPRIRSLTATLVSFETKFLVTDVNWRVQADPSNLDGHIDMMRTSGGFAILEDSEIDVPVNDLRLKVDFNREAVRAELNLDATAAGVITASATLPVEKNEQTQAWGLATDKPMEAALVAGLTDLKWLGPLASPTLRSAGSGQVSIVVSGTVDEPRAEGIAFARGLDLFELSQGVRLEDGIATVFFNNDKVEIREMDFTVYNRNVPRNRLEELAELIQGVGKLSVRGDWYIEGTGGEVNVNLDRVGLLQRADRWLMADGRIKAKQPVAPGEPIVVRGDVTALGAYVEIPDSGPTTLGDDVVLRGRQTEVTQAGALDLELLAKLGDKFYLNAQGLRSRLAGQMQLNVQQGVKTASGKTGSRLAANGTIQAVEGTYRAYGQDLTIERGVVNFQGPLANPGLNIRAVRKGVAVEAGVEVTGSAARPQVTLVSEPPVPDSEKLSWMIIGRGSDSSDRDANLLLTAAAAIFGDSDESTTRKIAKSVGIDDFALTSGSLTAADSRAVGSQVSIAPGADPSAAILGEDDPLLTQRIITLGKRINDEVTLFFEQSVTTAANIVKLNYQYSRRLSFILRGGADNAVDALYQFSFD